MVRAAVLASGEGLRLQAILDAVSFNELPGMKLVAVITPQKSCNAMKRALNMGVQAYVVDPDLFPNITSHSKAVANKLKDMDIDLVILADYDQPLGVIPLQFKNRIIGSCPSLYPAFDGYDGDVCQAVLERGIRITGATVYFCNSSGEVGPIILQKAVEVRPEDTPASLERKVIEECEWKLLPEAIRLFCKNRLSLHGIRVVIAEQGESED